MAADLEIPSNEPSTTSYDVSDQDKAGLGVMIQEIIDSSRNVIGVNVTRSKKGFKVSVTVSIMDIALQKNEVATRAGDIIDHRRKKGPL